MLAESGEGKFFGSWGEEYGDVVSENTGEDLGVGSITVLRSPLRMVAVYTMTTVIGNKIQ